MPRISPLAVVVLAVAAACGTDRPTVSAPPEVAPLTATLNSDASDPTPNTISLRKIGGFDGGGALAAEVTAYDEVSRRLFVVNGGLGTVDVLDLRNPAAPRKIGTISVAQFGASANGVDAHGGVVAVAVQGPQKTDLGTVAFYRATTLQLISSATVGALPDMVTFTPDGKTVLVANEGEPNEEYTIDPEGSVSIVDVRNINAPSVRTADFRAFNGQEAQLRAQGVRIFGPGASAAQDFEPEYIAVSEDGTTAFVALQENNALATIDIASATVTRLVPLGFKDHRLAGNALDVSDRDGPANGPAINIRNWPVFGMYQPDAIATYRSGGQDYIVTANEGDSRDWAGFSEESRVNALTLNPAIFTDEVCGGPCAANSRLGRLTVTTTLGKNASGSYDALYVFGARSFSIWSSQGSLVWDSGDQFEQLTSNLPMVNFNAGHQNNTLDDRSDNKGPEPEGIAIGALGSKRYAFIGLERVGGVMVYDITTPSAPFFVTYVNSRQGTTGDLGPEGLTFIHARRSPNKKNLVVVGNEVSGTTAIFQVDLH